MDRRSFLGGLLTAPVAALMPITKEGDLYLPDHRIITPITPTVEEAPPESFKRIDTAYGFIKEIRMQRELLDTHTFGNSHRSFVEGMKRMDILLEMTGSVNFFNDAMYERGLVQPVKLYAITFDHDEKGERRR